MVQMVPGSIQRQVDQIMKVLTTHTDTTTNLETIPTPGLSVICHSRYDFRVSEALEGYGIGHLQASYEREGDITSFSAM
jgi:hypothetical protein